MGGRGGWQQKPRLHVSGAHVELRPGHGQVSHDPECIPLPLGFEALQGRLDASGQWRRCMPRNLGKPGFSPALHLLKNP